MLSRPTHILSPSDISDPDFPAQCIAWTAQIRSEMQETIAATRRTIDESKLLIQEADRVLGQRRNPICCSAFQSHEAPVAAERR